jgi:maleate cis-trans isomerase
MTREIPDQPYGWRARIGYTSPPLTTEVFPYEFYKLVPDGVSLVVTTLAITVRSKEEIDRSYDLSIQATREMKAAGCDIICLGGVPINVSRGHANAETLITDMEAELGIKVSTSQSAQKKAAKALGARKVVMAHPYAQKDTERISGYNAHMGCETLGAMGWGNDFNKIGGTPRNAALIMGRKLMQAHPEADTIVFPSPHWPTLEAIDALEAEFKVNVMSALQVIVWDALRRLGINDRIQGAGRLFREF